MNTVKEVAGLLKHNLVQRKFTGSIAHKDQLFAVGGHRGQPSWPGWRVRRTRAEASLFVR